jgi:hypothetical protein
MIPGLICWVSEFLTDFSERVYQLTETVPADVAKAPFMLFSDDHVQLVDETPGFRGHSRSDPATVGTFSGALDQASVDHSIEQAGDVGHAGEQSLSELIATQTLRRRTSENPKHVELRGSNAVWLEHLLERVDEQRPGANDAQLSLLLDAAERLPLLDLLTQVRCHNTQFTCHDT